MLRIVLPGIFIFGASCAHSTSEMSLHHSVRVPSEFQTGRTAAGSPSDHERYLAAYEDAWWSCVGRFASNIQYETTSEDKWWNGWPAEVAGGWAGCSAAETRIQELKSIFGSETVQRFLHELLEQK